MDSAPYYPYSRADLPAKVARHLGHERLSWLAEQLRSPEGIARNHFGLGMKIRNFLRRGHVRGWTDRDLDEAWAPLVIVAAKISGHAPAGKAQPGGGGGRLTPQSAATRTGRQATK
jgi:hypothetical protein